jgi:glycogen(starch) synthase
MLVAGDALRERMSFDLIHSHDWLVAPAARELREACDVPWLVTIHATEHGRHQGWVKQHPQSTIHGHERAMARDADGVIVCSHYMRGHVADIFDLDKDRIRVIPNGIDPLDLAPVDDLAALRARFADPAEKPEVDAFSEDGRLAVRLGWGAWRDKLHALRRVLAHASSALSGDPGADASEELAVGHLAGSIDLSDPRTVVARWLPSQGMS